MSYNSIRSYVIQLWRKIFKQPCNQKMANIRTNESESLRRHVISLPTVFFESHPNEKRYQAARDKDNNKASWLAVWTFVAAVVAAVGAVYSGCQSKRQANAAEAANAPFVYFDKFTPYRQSADTYYVLKPRWVNNGASPAIKASLKTACGIEAHSVDSVSSADYRKIEVTPAIFAPKQDHMSGACEAYPLSPELVDKINSNQVFFFIGGIACYKALGSDKEHLSEFLYRVTRIDGQKEPTYVSTLAVGTQNCADEDCLDYKSMCN